MTAIDPQEVLQKYSAVMMKLSGTVIRNAEELPYPKEVIKAALRGCIEMLRQGDSDRETLKVAYIALADYQELTLEEEVALSVFASARELVDGSLGLKQTANLLASKGEAHSEIIARYNAELKQLMREVEGL